MMALLQSKKGFYASAPLMGAIIFLIAASVAFFFHNESLAQTDLARAGAIQTTLLFISQAILADSYNALLQSEFEHLTTEFLEGEDGESHLINPGGNWKSNLGDELIRKYGTSLKSGIGADATLYVDAYNDYSGIDYCAVVSSEVVSPLFLQSVFESEEDDGTIKTRAYSFGESVECIANDPQGRTKVEIRGRYYQIDIRVIGLFEVAKFSIVKAKETLDHGADIFDAGIKARWSSPRWYSVNDFSNTIREAAPDDEEAIEMEGLIEAWEKAAKTFSSLIKKSAKNEANKKFKGIVLGDFNVKVNHRGPYSDEEYDIKDFRVACSKDNAGEYRNCMPEFTHIILGDEKCENGGVPLHTGSRPYYKVKGEHRGSGGGELRGDITLFLTRIFKPLGYACYDIERSDPRGVCRKWETKPGDVGFEGTVTDDAERYTPSGADKISFNFMGQYPNVNTADITENLLDCRDRYAFGGENDKELWENNMKELLGGLEIDVVTVEQKGLWGWVDQNSKINGDSLETRLKNIYNDVVARVRESASFVPVVEFETGRGGIKNKEDIEVGIPRVKIWISWDAVLGKCEGVRDIRGGKGEADLLCDTLCDSRIKGTSGSVETGKKKEFCRNLVDKGFGRLECECMGSEFISPDVEAGFTIKKGIGF